MNKSQSSNLQNQVRQEYKDYLNQLFKDAWDTMPLDFIYTILRVSGAHCGHWDPLEEFYQASIEYNKFLKFAAKQKNQKALIRINLLLYCHLVELTAIHELIANLLRCKGREEYLIMPFLDLQIIRRNNPSSPIPPSATRKYKEIKSIASRVQDTQLPNIIESFFNEEIRNSFSHGDYCITENEFRWTEGGPASEKKLDEVSEITMRAFIFHEELFAVHKSLLLRLAKAPKFFQLPQYETLELLSDNSGLYGFKVHFSNGSSATYERRKDNVIPLNISPGPDRTINFMVGNLDELENNWKVNGEIVEDWDQLNRDFGTAANTVYTKLLTRIRGWFRKIKS